MHLWILPVHHPILHSLQLLLLSNPLALLLRYLSRHHLVRHRLAHILIAHEHLTHM